MSKSKLEKFKLNLKGRNYKDLNEEVLEQISYK